MSNLSLVDYTDTSSDEEEADSKITENLTTSGKKVAVVQPTLLGHVLQNYTNQAPGTPAYNPPSPSNTPVRNDLDQNQMDQSDMDDVAHILLELSEEGMRRENSQNSGNLSPVIEINSSPLIDPQGGEGVNGENDDPEVIDISSDSDTIPYEVPSSPLSDNSTPFDLYNEFDVIISDRSFTTGKKSTFQLFLPYLNKYITRESHNNI